MRKREKRERKTITDKRKWGNEKKESDFVLFCFVLSVVEKKRIYLALSRLKTHPTHQNI